MENKFTAGQLLDKAKAIEKRPACQSGDDSYLLNTYLLDTNLRIPQLLLQNLVEHDPLLYGNVQWHKEVMFITNRIAELRQSIDDDRILEAIKCTKKAEQQKIVDDNQAG